MYRAKVKSDDPVVSKRWAYGGKADIDGRMFIIPDDATLEDVDGDWMIRGFIEVIPESVGQYWGKDRDGYDIYVGDEVCPLVRRTDAMRGKVIYDEETGGYRIDVGTEEYVEVCPDDCKLLTDNPKLLEDKC